MFFKLRKLIFVFFDAVTLSQSTRQASFEMSQVLDYFNHIFSFFLKKPKDTISYIKQMTINHKVHYMYPTSFSLFFTPEVFFQKWNTIRLSGKRTPLAHCVWRSRFHIKTTHQNPLHSLAIPHAIYNHLTPPPSICLWPQVPRCIYPSPFAIWNSTSAMRRSKRKLHI